MPIRHTRALLIALALAAIVRSGVSAAKLSPQTPLDATSIPQFVENLPDFSVLGRVNGDIPYRVRSEEFQQKILPAAFYAGLPAPFTAGTMVFGYGIDQGAAARSAQVGRRLNIHRRTKNQAGHGYAP